MLQNNFETVNEIHKFESYDGSFFIELTDQKLQKYPDCLFSKMVKYNFSGDKKENVYVTKLTLDTLKAVEMFFITGYWPNPYLYNSLKLEIVGENYSFEEICDFLGLPDDIENISDDEDDDIDENGEYYEICKNCGSYVNDGCCDICLDLEEEFRIKQQEDEEELYSINSQWTLLKPSKFQSFKHKKY